MNDDEELDFTIWFRLRSDPDGHASIHPHSDRAYDWCFDNIDYDGPFQTMELTNDEAYQLRERLEAAGFNVMGAS
jgi:hypothetical protein